MRRKYEAAREQACTSCALEPSGMYQMRVHTQALTCRQAQPPACAPSNARARASTRRRTRAPARIHTHAHTHEHTGVGAHSRKHVLLHASRVYWFLRAPQRA
eukprot:5533731-Pleurochrysis_carterae.AAC.1